MVLDKLKKHFSTVAGIPCKFENEEINNKECVLYLDSVLTQKQTIINGDKIFQVAGRVFLISQTDGCQKNDAFLYDFSCKADAQFEDEIQIERETTYIKYSIGFSNFRVKINPADQSGFITDIDYNIKGV